MRSRQDSARQRSGRDPVLLCLVFIAAAAIVLAGCGNLSLTNLLENESPGAFRLSPETVNLPVGTEFTFSATGGFEPYNYQVVSGLGDVAKDQTWVYQAPKDIGTEPYIEVIIQATDKLGDSDTATVRVFNPFSITPNSAVTILLGGSVSIQAAGGVPPYSWAVDGTAVSTGSTSYDYAPATEGTYVVSVTDTLGNYKEVTITVLPPNPPLTIDPVAAGVHVDGTVTFTAFGGTPDYSWATVTNPISPAIGTPVIYTATTEGTDTVTLTDSTGTSVSATVTVTAGTIEPLMLSPESPTVAAVGDQVQFSATGGVAPYKFTTAPAPHGSIDPVTGLYTQKTAGKDVKVTVTDTVGITDQTFVRWASP